MAEPVGCRNVFDGVKHKLDLVHRFNEVSHLMADPDQDMDKLMEEQAALMVGRAGGWLLHSG